MKSDSERQRFDDVVRKIMSISHDENLGREVEWKRRRDGIKSLATQRGKGFMLFI
jgi:hypothetical protein